MKNPHLFDYIEVESSNIKAYGYNPVYDILSVVFHSGEEYWYFEVDAHAWADLYEAESKGKHLNEYIKNHYRYLKVTMFEQDILIDAIEFISRKNANDGHISMPFSEICRKLNLDFADTWDKVMGRREWYQYQPDEYKARVKQKASEIELHQVLGY